jgi:putative tricarboxylic transport membrane protein
MFMNAASGFFLLILSAGYYFAADAMPSSILDTTVTSSAFPKMLALAGGFLSIALIVQNIFVVATAGRNAPAKEPDERGGGGWPAHRRALGLLAIVLCFVLALEVVGYPVAIGLLILAVSVYQGYPLSKLSVGIAVAGGLFFWLFFMVLLGIHMPLGIWTQLAGLLPFQLPFA